MILSGNDTGVTGAFQQVHLVGALWVALLNAHVFGIWRAHLNIRTNAQLQPETKRSKEEEEEGKSS